MKFYKEKTMTFKQQNMKNIQTTQDNKGDSFKYGDPIKFFHTYEPNGQICYQGFIDTVLDNGDVSGVLFSFFDGSMNGRRTLRQSELQDCSFYNSAEAMTSEYYRHQAFWDKKNDKLMEAI